MTSWPDMPTLIGAAVGALLAYAYFIGRRR